jgi:hypothetical protein
MVNEEIGNDVFVLELVLDVLLVIEARVLIVDQQTNLDVGINEVDLLELILDVHLQDNLLLHTLFMLVTKFQKLDAFLYNRESVVIVEYLLPILVQILDFVQNSLELGKVRLTLDRDFFLLLHHYLDFFGYLLLHLLNLNRLLLILNLLLVLRVLLALRDEIVRNWLLRDKLLLLLLLHVPHIL